MEGTNLAVWASKKFRGLDPEAVLEGTNIPPPPPLEKIRFLSTVYFIGLDTQKDHHLNVYLTAGYEEIQKSKDNLPKDTAGLFYNSNEYKIDVNFKSSFTILHESVLSRLKDLKFVAGDFVLHQYNSDSIHLKSYNAEVKYQDIVFRSYDFNENVKAFFNFCQYLFYSTVASKYGDHLFSTSYYIFGYQVQNSTKKIVKSGALFFFNNPMIPFFDKNKKLFSFKLSDLKAVKEMDLI